MCLAVPGKILDIRPNEVDATLGSTGRIDFQGTQLEASLLFTPEARPGDWVLVHAGFALSVLNESEAMETWKYLEQEDTRDIADCGLPIADLERRGQ